MFIYRYIHLARVKRHVWSQTATLCYWLLVCLADIQIIRRYPEGAEESNLSRCTGPGNKVDKERGSEREREREIASGLSCQKGIKRERF